MWKVYAAYEDIDAYTSEYDPDDHFIWKKVAWNISTKREANDIAEMIHFSDWDIVRIFVTKATPEF